MTKSIWRNFCSNFRKKWICFEEWSQVKFAELIIFKLFQTQRRLIEVNLCCCPILLQTKTVCFRTEIIMLRLVLYPSWCHLSLDLLTHQGENVKRGSTASQWGCYEIAGLRVLVSHVGVYASLYHTKNLPLWTKPNPLTLANHWASLPLFIISSSALTHSLLVPKLQHLPGHSLQQQSIVGSDGIITDPYLELTHDYSQLLFRTSPTFH